MNTAYPSIEVHIGSLPGIDRQALDAEFSGFQRMFFDEFGVIIPPLSIQEDPDLPDNGFQVIINGQSQPLIESLSEGEFWLYLPASQLQEQRYFDRLWDARQAVEPNSGSAASIVRGSEEDRQIWADAGSDTRSRQGYVVFSVAAEIRRQPASFLTQQLLHYYLTRLNESYPDLIDTSNALLDQNELFNMLQSYLQTGKSIQNLPALLEQMLITNM